MKRIIQMFLLYISMAYLMGCAKFLDERTDKKLALPNTLSDLQALLDNSGIINGVDAGNGQVAGDEYYMLEKNWSTLSEQDRRGYTWESSNSSTYNSWMTTYRTVYYANVVLEALDVMGKPDGADGKVWDDIAGQAYFLRAKSHLAAASIWTVAYDDLTADTDLGIPLRSDPDINTPSKRATNRGTYTHIAEDLEAAIDLLPNRPQHVLRAGKVAAHALLARTYLFMRDYERCLQHAESSLAINSTLLDYNQLDTLSAYPFERFNEETIYACWNGFNPVLQESRVLIDSNLYKLYDQEDLRRVAFFRRNQNNTVSFKGSYTGSSLLFSGVAVDETYLMAAECHARTGALQEALSRLNQLLEKRYKTGMYQPIQTSSKTQLLEIILAERRKELLLRGIRFPDVKRLNKEGKEIGFKRHLEDSDQDFWLPPNDLRFALPISEEVLARAPGMVQNPY